MPAVLDKMNVTQNGLTCKPPLFSYLTEKKPRKPSFPGLMKKAQTGFEPVNQGVADPRLTAWLLRRIYLTIKV